MKFHADNTTGAFDPLRAVRACLKRWRLATAVFATFCVISLVAVLQIRPKYESEGSIVVQLGRESAGLDPTATTSEVAPIYETREQELNSALEVMRSRKILEAVIGVIGQDVILNPQLFDFNSWQTRLHQNDWMELDPTLTHHSNAKRELAVEKLYRAITLEVEDSSSVITVTSTAATPDLAQAISRTMMDAYLAEHVRLNQTHGLSFFGRQVQMLQQQLNTARQLQTDRRNSLGIMSIEGERERLEDVLTAVEKQLNISVPQLEGAKASVTVIEREVRSLPDRTQPHDASDTLRKKLYELQQRRSILMASFTPQHYRVKDIAAEIELVSGQLSDPRNRNAANPTLRELEVSLAAERAKVAQSAAEIEELRIARERVQAQLLKLNDAESEMMQLKDSVDELKTAKLKANEKLEQARILNQLSQERISNIRVVQPPTFNPISMSPSRSLALIAGVIVGAMGAFVIPAVVEFSAWYLEVLRGNESDGDESVKDGVVVCG